MKILLIIISGVYILMVTWLFYLAIMNLKRNKNKITKTAIYFAYPIIIIGILFDVALNVLVGTIIFLELPREFVFTSRLQRHIAKSKGWRLKRAEWFCYHILDPFDPSGKHC